MTPLPLFYSSIAVLDRNTHRASTLAPVEKPYAFATGSHVLPALMLEFGLGGRDMPILFLDEASGVSPLFLVGMHSGRCDFIDPEGRWTGLHAPAYLRRYPFIGGDVSEQQQVVCVDGGFAGLSEAEGERLFTDEGEPADALQRIVAFVSEYGDAAKATAAFTAELKSLDLFQSINIDIRAPNGASSSFSGFAAVSQERLSALPDDALLHLARTGYLAAIHAHFVSLSNIGPLGDRFGRQVAQA